MKIRSCQYKSRDLLSLEPKRLNIIQTSKENMSNPQTNSDPIDYLAINRARWDERAPHVRIILTHANVNINKQV